MTAPVRVLIADDEPLARERIRRLLAQESDVAIVGLCTDGASAIDRVLVERPDLVFLDVQMPEADGFEVADALLERLGADEMPVIVFATAYDQHALRAFEAQATDYLVKPFSDERFAAMLVSARRRVRQRRIGTLGDQLRQLLDVAPAPRDSTPPGDHTAAPNDLAGPLERLVLRSGSRARVVPAAEIDWIAADGVYARVHVGPTAFLLRMPMHELELRLDGRRFVRIHRSTLVNLDRVREIHELERGEFRVQLADGTRLKLSRSRRASLELVLRQRL